MDEQNLREKTEYLFWKMNKSARSLKQLTEALEAIEDQLLSFPDTGEMTEDVRTYRGYLCQIRNNYAREINNLYRNLRYCTKEPLK